MCFQGGPRRTEGPGVAPRGRAGRRRGGRATHSPGSSLAQGCQLGCPILTASRSAIAVTVGELSGMHRTRKPRLKPPPLRFACRMGCLPARRWARPRVGRVAYLRAVASPGGRGCLERASG